MIDLGGKKLKTSNYSKKTWSNWMTIKNKFIKHRIWFFSGRKAVWRLYIEEAQGVKIWRMNWILPKTKMEHKTKRVK